MNNKTWGQVLRMCGVMFGFGRPFYCLPLHREPQAYSALFFYHEVHGVANAQKY